MKNEVFDWLYLDWSDNTIQVYSKMTLAELFSALRVDFVLEPEEAAANIKSSKLMLLRSEDGINFTNVKLIPPKDVWSSQPESIVT